MIGWKCPYCGEDRIETNEAHKNIIPTIVKYFTVVSEYADPGGRALVFENKETKQQIKIRVDDQCVNCNLTKIQNGLNL